MRDLLPRNLFERNPNFFRQDAKGNRNPDSNLCVHSSGALDLIAENAVTFASILTPDTSRYFYWGDDGLPWCECSQCKELTPSDQALVVENRILQGLRTIDTQATLAHLAYTNTLAPPKLVKPAKGIFLEYAPIHRRYDLPYKEQLDPAQPDGLHLLDANLKVFPSETAQVLEYWLDVSMFSKWMRPAVQLPWRRDVLESDLSTYASRGIRHITSFAVYVDDAYKRLHGEPEFIHEYGKTLKSFTTNRRTTRTGQLPPRISRPF